MRSKTKEEVQAYMQPKNDFMWSVPKLDETEREQYRNISVEIEQKVSKCTSLEELEEAVSKLPEEHGVYAIEGSWTDYPIHDIIRRIQNFKDGNTPAWNHITRSCGLRRKVMEICGASTDEIERMAPKENWQV